MSSQEAVRTLSKGVTANLSAEPDTKSPMQDEKVIEQCRRLLSVPSNPDRPSSPVQDMIKTFDELFFGFIVGQRKVSLDKNVSTRRVRPTPVGQPQTAVPIKEIETPVPELKSPTKKPESPASPKAEDKETQTPKKE